MFNKAYANFVPIFDMHEIMHSQRTSVSSRKNFCNDAPF